MCLRIKEYFEEKKARKQVLNMDDLTIDQKVKIQGTKFDRKRKYDKALFDQMKFELAQGATVKELSAKYSINQLVIRYNTDDNFRKLHNAKRKKGAHGVGVMDFDNRVDYKRTLVKTKKIKVAGVVNAGI